MVYYNSGSLTTDERTVDDSASWDTQTEWAAYQSLNQAEIVSGVVQLAEIPGIVDSFEDGDIAEYSGDVSLASVSTTEAWSGSNSLAMDSSGSPVGITSTSGRPVYPAAGDTFETWFMASDANNGGPQITFAAGQETDPPSDCYLLQVILGNGELRLLKIVGGSTTELDISASAAFSVSSMVWYRIVIDWGAGGVIECRIEDQSGTVLVSISGNDTTFSSGGVGFRNGGATTPVYHDYMRIL